MPENQPSSAENDAACRYCGVGDRVCIEYNESGRGIKCCPDCDHRPAAENDVPDLIDRIAEVLNVHRWKSMGVASVECECGKVISQGAESPTLTAFPADEAFRRHIAAEVTRVLPPGLREGGE
jgi:hypothetical protein